MVACSGYICKAFANCRSFCDCVKKIPVLTLFTKDPCPLCDIAKERIAHLSDEFHLQTVDITDPANEHWWEKYKYDIPVFHFEGKFLMQHKADISLLKKVLDEYHRSTV